VLATANIGTTLFEVLENNQIGIVAEPENDPALYQAIVSGLESDYDNMRIKAREYAIANIALDGVMHKFLKDVHLC
jgi:colanic acid biosynthesis glycosyl transferase WcaI